MVADDGRPGAGRGLGFELARAYGRIISPVEIVEQGQSLRLGLGGGGQQGKTAEQPATEGKGA